MGKTLWKIVFPMDMLIDRQRFDVPIGAVIRYCGMQTGGYPALWYECDPDADHEERTFALVGTGRKIPEGSWVYRGTSQSPTDRYVWHWYEEL
jgi:hypothetical protein